GTDSIGSANVASVSVAKTRSEERCVGEARTGAFSTTNANLAVALNGVSNSIGGAGTFLNDSNVTLGTSGGTSTFTGGLDTTGATGTNTLNGTIATTNTALTTGAVTLGSAVTLNAGTNNTTTRAVTGAQALTLQGSGTDSIGSANVASVSVAKT